MRKAGNARAGDRVGAPALVDIVRTQGVVTGRGVKPGVHRDTARGFVDRRQEPPIS